MDNRKDYYRGKDIDKATMLYDFFTFSYIDKSGYTFVFENHVLENQVNMLICCGKSDQ